MQAQRVAQHWYSVYLTAKITLLFVRVRPIYYVIRKQLYVLNLYTGPVRSSYFTPHSEE